MFEWFLIVACAIAMMFLFAIKTGQARETRKAELLRKQLNQGVGQSVRESVNFSSLSFLPPPVDRYLKHVLTDGQAMIKTVEMQQSGKLRTSTNNKKWYRFTSSQVISPFTTGFVWDAKVEMPLATHIRVHDSYHSGIGSGRVAFLSAFAVGSDNNIPELNSAALHRYLAEGVWYPTALLPQSGVTWSAIDDNSALATLTHNNITVSLKFRFNSEGEVTGISTPERFYRNSNGTYQAMPWKIQIANYKVQHGMRIPFHAEVGWHIDGALELVWIGEVINAQYQFSN